MIERLSVTRIKGHEREVIDDLVVSEIPLTINIGENELVTLLCCPSDLEDLVAGFLFSSGLIKKAEDIKKIVINRQQWIAYVDLVEGDIDQGLVFKRLYTSGCGRGTIFYNALDIINRIKIISDFRISSDRINELMFNFHKSSQVYLKTGGVHGAALADKEGILIFKEDIGRHNAVDKIIGCHLKEKGDFEGKILISSGRISSEILFKVQKARIPVLVSQSAPTDQAVKLAKDMDLTLIGFARGNKMNIYSREERVI